MSSDPSLDTDSDLDHPARPAGTPAAVSSAPRMTLADFSQILPAAVPALRALSQSIDVAGLDRGLVELLKVRVSQLNGCAFCLRIHLDWALKAGLSADKLDLVAVWPDVPAFDARERAGLAWAEALTRMPMARVDEAAHVAVSAVFSTTEIAALTTAIAAINAWNRIAGPLRFAPGAPAAPQRETPGRTADRPR